MEKTDDWKLPRNSQKYVDALNAKGEYSTAAKHSIDVGHLQMQRRLLIENELSGDASNLSKASSVVKSKYLRLDKELVALGQVAFDNLPVFEDVLEKYENLEFLRDDKGRFIEAVNGWYQNVKGELYHYDGVVWDNVPNEKVSELEYLG